VDVSEDYEILNNGDLVPLVQVVQSPIIQSIVSQPATSLVLVVSIPALSVLVLSVSVAPEPEDGNSLQTLVLHSPDRGLGSQGETHPYTMVPSGEQLEAMSIEVLEFPLIQAPILEPMVLVSPPPTNIKRSMCLKVKGLSSGHVKSS
jgi:hypothetical protein